MNYMFGYSDTTRGFFFRFFRYLLFKFWQAILPFLWGIYSLSCSNQLGEFKYWHRATLYLKIYFPNLPESRLDRTSIQRRTVVLATAYHSFLPPSPDETLLPSSLALVHPRSPNNVTVLLDNYYWYIYIRQSSDNFYTNVMYVSIASFLRCSYK